MQTFDLHLLKINLEHYDFNMPRWRFLIYGC